MLSRFEPLYEKASGLLDRAVMILGVSCVGIFIFYYGFPLEPRIYEMLGYALYGIALVFILQEFLRFLFCPQIKVHFRSRRIEILFVVLLFLTLFSEEIISYFLPNQLTQLDVRNIAIAYLALTQTLIFSAQMVRSLRGSEVLSHYEMTPSRLMVVSFATPILLGAALLKLPNATVNGIGWLDALFTSTSAVCVTGLVVLDTQKDFTPMGQTLIAMLFQIGGLGIMTITMSFGFLFSRGLAMKERILFSELLAEERLGKVGNILFQVTFYTLIAEGVGATLLYISRGGSLTHFDFHLFLSAAFHSISAFCNAGFSLFSQSLYAETCFVVIFLMWIGGSPMSTAGGIKTLTVAVAWLNLTATLKGAQRIVVFGREITRASLHKAFAIIFGSILILILASGALILLEPSKSRLDLIFEVVSAFGTVGLSRGVTADLSSWGKFLIISMMFVGRLGFLTVLNSFYSRYREPHYKVLKENINVS